MLASKSLVLFTLSFFFFSTGYGKQVPVYFEISPELFDTIITDEEWLWQMLLNLLTNACKYTQKGRIDVKLSLLRDQEVEQERESVDTALQHAQVPKLKMQSQSEPADMLLCEVIDTGER